MPWLLFSLRVGKTYSINRIKIAKVVEWDKNGKLTLNFCATQASENWLLYGRLKKLADEGDEEARKECERMDNAKIVTYEEE